MYPQCVPVAMTKAEIATAACHQVPHASSTSCRTDSESITKSGVFVPGPGHCGGRLKPSGLWLKGLGATTRCTLEGLAPSLASWARHLEVPWAAVPTHPGDALARHWAHRCARFIGENGHTFLEVCVFVVVRSCRGGGHHGHSLGMLVALRICLAIMATGGWAHG